jgi:hypothetical protein
MVETPVLASRALHASSTMAACAFPTKPRADRALYRARTEELDLLRIGPRRPARRRHPFIETAKLNDIDPQAWRTSSRACRTIRRNGSTSSCPGLGARRTSLLKRLEQAASSTKSAIPRGLHRTRTIEQVAVMLRHQLRLSLDSRARAHALPRAEALGVLK